MEQKHTARRLGWHMHSFGTSFCWVAMSTVSTRNSPEHSPYVTVGESSQSTFLSITSCIFHIRSSGTSLTHVRVQHRSLATHMHAFSKRGPAHWPCRTVWVWLLFSVFVLVTTRTHSMALGQSSPPTRSTTWARAGQLMGRARQRGFDPRSCSIRHMLGSTAPTRGSLSFSRNNGRHMAQGLEPGCYFTPYWPIWKETTPSIPHHTHHRMPPTRHGHDHSHERLSQSQSLRPLPRPEAQL